MKSDNSATSASLRAFRQSQMNRPLRCFYRSALLFCLSTLTLLADVTIFGPQQYMRDTGPPQTVTASFTVLDLTGPFKLIVQNGTSTGDRASSATVTLNGSDVIGPADFNQQVNLITKTVTLQGQNELSVRIESKPGSIINITITAPGVPLTASQTINRAGGNPNGIFVNEPTTITFTAQVGIDPRLITNSVSLLEYDGSNNLIRALGQLYDDGSHGDQLPGDNIFTTQLTLNELSSTTLYFRVSASYSNTTVKAFSPRFTINVVTHITDAEFAPVLAIPNQGQQQYSSFVGQGMSSTQARDQTIAWLLRQPSVLQAGSSDNGFGIWILYQSGLLGGIELNPGNTKGGVPRRLPLPFARRSLIGRLISGVRGICPLVTGGSDSVGNRKVIALGAFHETVPVGFEPYDEPDEIAALMRAAACPFDVTESYNTQVTVSAFKSLSSYGTVIISSHGDTWYQGILSLWFQKFGWTVPGSQVVVYTREQATSINRATYELDLRMGRLAVGNGNWYVILPSFISFYDQSFPQSIVYMSSCRSLLNNSMANAFLSNGANTYFGYSNYVDSSFSNSTGIQLFTDLVTNGKTTGQAFPPGTHDTSSPPAYFLISGDTNLALPANVVGNGGFETGDFNSWTTGGAGYSAVVTGNAIDGTYSARLGRFDEVYAGGVNGPPVGNEPYGYDYMYQDVLLPTATTNTITLTFSYDIQTYDAIPYDWFDMQIQDPSTGSILASIVHDGKPGYQYGTYADLGWKNVSFDLTSLSGRKVRLWFGTRQDGFGDQTATWVDNVRINCH